MSAPNPLIFANKTIAITGAARGIGLAVARYVAARGANLALADIESSELTSSSESLQRDFPAIRLTITVVDVRSSEAVDKWFADTLATFGELHGAVNNAGVLGKFGVIGTIKDDDWERVMSINVNGVMRCLRAELPIIQEGGSIVNMSSLAGLKGGPGLGPYCTSKHAVIGLTKVAAAEAGARRVRVNAVCPGSIETLMLDEVAAGAASMGGKIPSAPIARFGRPEEVAALVGYLLGPESAYTSGACIPVDGGSTC